MREPDRDRLTLGDSAMKAWCGRAVLSARTAEQLPEPRPPRPQESSVDRALGF